MDAAASLTGVKAANPGVTRYTAECWHDRISHVQIWLDPAALTGIEAFAPMLELLDRSSKGRGSCVRPISAIDHARNASETASQLPSTAHASQYE